MTAVELRNPHQVQGFGGANTNAYDPCVPSQDYMWHLGTHVKPQICAAYQGVDAFVWMEAWSWIKCISLLYKFVLDWKLSVWHSTWFCISVYKCLNYLLYTRLAIDRNYWSQLTYRILVVYCKCFSMHGVSSQHSWIRFLLLILHKESLSLTILSGHIDSPLVEDFEEIEPVSG